MAEGIVFLAAGWTVCGEAVDGLDALEKAKDLHRDVVLMDVSMPRMITAHSSRWLQGASHAAISDTHADEDEQGRTEVLTELDATDGFYAIDKKGRFTDLNAAARKLCQEHGLNPDDLIGKRIFDEAFADARESEYHRAIDRCMRERVNTEVENFYSPWQRWYFIRSFPADDGGVATFFRDITEQKWSESLLEEQKRLLELMARGGSMEESLMALTDSATRLDPGIRAGVVIADEARTKIERVIASRILPSFGERIQGMPINDTEIGTCTTAMFAGQPVTCADIAGNDRWSSGFRDLCLAHDVRSIYSTPALDSEGAAIGSFFICFTEPHEPNEWERRMAEMGAHISSIAIGRWRSKEGLRDREERFRALFEQTTGGIAEKDLNGRFTLVNDRFCEMVGRSRDELLNMRWQDITHPDDVARNLPQFLALAEGSGPNFVIEKRYLRQDGQTVWVRNQVSGVRNASGAVIKMLAVITDISDLKKTEEELRAAESSLKDARDTLELRVQRRTAELEQAQMDLRNLSAKLLAAQDEERRRIARDLHDSAGQALAALGMTLAVIEQKAERSNSGIAAAAAESQLLVQQVTREIRTMSYMLHPPLLDESGLSDALRLYVRGLSERTGLNIDLSVSGDFGRLPNQSELAIFRIIQESLTNIHKHSRSRRAWIRLFRKANYIHVEIEDEGRGISAKKLNHHGFGVGLAGMRERADGLRGELVIESSDRGTKISVILPANPSPGMVLQPVEGSLKANTLVGGC